MNSSIFASINEPRQLFEYKAYLFDEYNYCYDERAKIKKNIILALNEKVSCYNFQEWYRSVSTKYVNHPLSCKGSVKNATGGRFNIGSIDVGRFPTFPALYIGNSKEVCIQEIYDGMEDFLQAKGGCSFFMVSGRIESVLDLTKKNCVNKFIEVIGQITPSEDLIKRHKKIKGTSPEFIQTITQFKNYIYDKKWKRSPNSYNIPALSQIFGQLVKEAGIEAIIYRSTKNSRHGLCMAIFPENFKNSDSYVELKDISTGIQHKRMDSKTFKQFY